jgi:hypothetical protein
VIDNNVKDYGAAGDGTRDDRDEIAHAASTAGADRSIYFPPGAYRVSSNLTIACATVFAPGARLAVDRGITVTLNGAMIAGLTRIFSGAGRIRFGEGRVLEVYPQWWGAVDDQRNTTDATAAIQSALNALGVWGGRVVLPQGRYIVTSSVVVPQDATDGRTIEIVGHGEAVLHNRAPRNNPTLRASAASSPASHHRLDVRNLVFTGESQFPNHGLHLRFVTRSTIEQCVFCCHGSGIYTDGGVHSLVIRNVQVWPSTRKHRSPTTHTGSSGILFDTPVENAGYAHTITIDDLLVEAGGRGVELKSGYAASGWRIGRTVCEGLTGGNGYGLDLSGLRESEIGPMYTETNSSVQKGDSNDLMIRMNDCARVTVIGGLGTGKILVRNSVDVSFNGTHCQMFDADASNERINAFGVKHSTMGGPAAGYRNLSRDKTEWGVSGAGAAAPRVPPGDS